MTIGTEQLWDDPDFQHVRAAMERWAEEVTVEELTALAGKLAEAVASLEETVRLLQESQTSAIWAWHLPRLVAYDLLNGVEEWRALAELSSSRH